MRRGRSAEHQAYEDGHCHDCDPPHFRVRELAVIGFVCAVLIGVAYALSR